MTGTKQPQKEEGMRNTAFFVSFLKTVFGKIAVKKSNIVINFK
jgi:hypothetical protein